MIAYACSDLIFATKIGSTAQALGVIARPTRDTPMLAARLDQIDDGKPNGPVSLLLVDLDLADAALALIAQAKSHAAPPRVVAFGSHVATELLQAAHDHGADDVFPRSRFVAILPDLLKSHA